MLGNCARGGTVAAAVEGGTARPHPAHDGRPDRGPGLAGRQPAPVPCDVLRHLPAADAARRADALTDALILRFDKEALAAVRPSEQVAATERANLKIPPYSFEGDNKLVIGVDTPAKGVA